jgi:hypothetical protein
VPEPYEISQWFATPPVAAHGRALVLPGAGTVDHPALFWACQVLVQVGWEVTTMRWDADGLAEADRRSFVERSAELIDTEVGDHKVLVLAKSRVLRRQLGVASRLPGHLVDAGDDRDGGRASRGRPRSPSTGLARVVGHAR